MPLPLLDAEPTLLLRSPSNFPWPGPLGKGGPISATSFPYTSGHSLALCIVVFVCGGGVSALFVAGPSPTQPAVSGHSLALC